MKKIRNFVAMMLCILLVLQIALPQNGLKAFAKETKQTFFEDDCISIQFQVLNEWENHYQAEIILTNTAKETIKNWVIEYDSADTYEQIWNASVLSRDEETYRIKNVGYNQDIQPGQSVSFGVIGSYELEPDIPDYYECLGTLKEVNEDAYSVTPYVQSKWNTGCILELELHNTSNSTIEDWQLDVACQTPIQSMWNGTLHKMGDGQYIVYSQNHNSNIPAGESVWIGMQLNWTDGKEVYPEHYALSDYSLDFSLFERGELIKELYHNGFTYYFTYDENENMTKASVNDHTLFEASYQGGSARYNAVWQWGTSILHL